MGGLIIVVAIIVIVCYIMWRKNQNKNTPREKNLLKLEKKLLLKKYIKKKSLKISKTL